MQQRQRRGMIVDLAQLFLQLDDRRIKLLDEARRKSAGENLHRITQILARDSKQMQLRRIAEIRPRGLEKRIDPFPHSQSGGCHEFRLASAGLAAAPNRLEKSGHPALKMPVMKMPVSFPDCRLGVATAFCGPFQDARRGIAAVMLENLAQPRRQHVEIARCAGGAANPFDLLLEPLRSAFGQIRLECFDGRDGPPGGHPQLMDKLGVLFGMLCGRRRIVPNRMQPIVQYAPRHAQDRLVRRIDRDPFSFAAHCGHRREAGKSRQPATRGDGRSGALGGLRRISATAIILRTGRPKQGATPPVATPSSRRDGCRKPESVVTPVVGRLSRAVRGARRLGRAVPPLSPGAPNSKLDPRAIMRSDDPKSKLIPAAGSHRYE